MLTSIDVTKFPLKVLTSVNAPPSGSLSVKRMFGEGNDVSSKVMPVISLQVSSA